MHLRQNAVAAFNGRGGALKNFDSVSRPRLPLHKDVGGQPLRDGVLLKRCPHRFQCLLYLGFPSVAPRPRLLVGPIDHREEARVYPVLPLGREEEGLQILVDPLPPEVHQRGQCWDLGSDFGHGLVTGRQLVTLR
jgi:hypothetical protein